jgi:Na+-translocating ferredoxin:NAD+ oxidoreductase subunit C
MVTMQKEQLADHAEQSPTANLNEPAADTSPSTAELQQRDAPSVSTESAKDNLATGASSNDRVQAAIARAKAKKASAALANDKLAEESNSAASDTNEQGSDISATPLPAESPPSVPPASAQAASTEQTKLKRSKAINPSQDTKHVDSELAADNLGPNPSVSDPLEDKQQKIASAVAKAKAKRLSK